MAFAAVEIREIKMFINCPYTLTLNYICHRVVKRKGNNHNVLIGGCS